MAHDKGTASSSGTPGTVNVELENATGTPSGGAQPKPTPVLDGLLEGTPPAAGGKPTRTPRKAKPAPDEDTDPVAAAMAHHNATVAAEEKAQTAITSQSAVIIADWCSRHATEQSWMIRAGQALSEYLAAYIALKGIASRADGVAAVCQEVEDLTGTDYSGEMSRCLLVYHAALEFGTDAISALPVDAQRGFATLMVRTPDKDGKDCETYVLPTSIANQARKLLAWTLCDRLAAATVPAHIAEQLPRATRAKSQGNKSRKPGVGWKGGLMCKGREVNLMCGKLNRYAIAVSKGDASVVNPWDVPTAKSIGTPATITPPTTTGTTTTGTTGTGTTGTTTPPVTPPVTPPATGTTGTTTLPTAGTTAGTTGTTTPAGKSADDGKGEERREQGTTDLPVLLTGKRNPQLVAKAIIGGLQSADDQGAVLAALGQMDEWTPTLFDGILAGMIAGKRVKELNAMAALMAKAAAKLKGAK